MASGQPPDGWERVDWYGPCLRWRTRGSNKSSELLQSIVQRITQWLRSVDGALAEHSSYRVARNSLLGLSQRDSQRKAAAMTYFAVFSIFPFILLMIALLSFLIDSQQAQEQIISALSDFFPSGSTGVQSVIQGVINARGVAAGFGIVLLLWGTLGWFQAIDQGVNEMWGVSGTRSFFGGKLFALAMIGGIALVMLLSWLANIVVGVIKGIAYSSGFDVLPGATGLWDLLVGAVTLALMFLLFMLLYRYSPRCDISWGEVWRGALITAFLWSVLRSGFAIYVTHFANFQSAYGPIGAVIAFLLWLYLAHILILYGAELTYTMRLDAQGIHELQDLPCGVPQQRPADGDRRGRARAA